MDLFRRHLFAKLAVVVVVGVAVGFSIFVALSAHIRAELMVRQHRDAATSLARSLAAGVRTAMLTGNGNAVQSLLDEAKAGVRKADIKIYSPKGEEVFMAPPKPKPPHSWPEHIRDALNTGAIQKVAADVTAFPIDNESRCRSCHEKGERRGVLTIGSSGGSMADTRVWTRSVASSRLASFRS
jgi:hypothetical protein